MIHLKYKCKVNFVKLPLIWIDLCLKLVFENDAAGPNTGRRSVVNCASYVGESAGKINACYAVSKINACDAVGKINACYAVSPKPPAGFVSAVHMRACTGLKKCP